MHHLQHAVVKAGRAGDVAKLADRQKLLQIVTTGVKKVRIRVPVSSLA
jgi:hypothetical protein